VVDDVGFGHDFGQVPARKIDRDEVEARPLPRAVQVPQLLRSGIVVVEAIDAHDGLTVCEQRLGQVRPDEAGASGDHRGHRRSL